MPRMISFSQHFCVGNGGDQRKPPNFNREIYSRLKIREVSAVSNKSIHTIQVVNNSKTVNFIQYLEHTCIHTRMYVFICTCDIKKKSFRKHEYMIC